jgi:hypothetical protein
MKGVTKGTSCRDIFRELKILTVTSLNILQVLSYFEKHNIYTTKNDLYEYDTRRKENLHVKSYHTLTCEKGVVNMAIKLHNNLPMELRKEKGERKFKIFIGTPILYTTGVPIRKTVEKVRIYCNSYCKFYYNVSSLKVTESVIVTVMEFYA